MPRAPADDFKTLELEVRRQRLEEEAAKLVATARGRLVLGPPPGTSRGPSMPTCAFFAILAMKLHVQPNWDIETADVDGRTMRYNPEFITGLTPQKRLGLIAHEVMHCALSHMSRRQGREPKRWNIACDLAINHILLEASFELPDAACVPGKGPFASMPVGLSSEAYYNLLPEQSGQGGGDDPGGCGGVVDAGSSSGQGGPAAQAAAEADWQINVAEAEKAAKDRGNLPAGLDRSASEAVRPTADWRQHLRRFLTMSARNDYSWSPPNRRFIHLGLYLPSLRSEDAGTIVVCVDTSGSITKQMLGQFAAELETILQSLNVTLRIMYHDVEVAKVAEWSSMDGPLVFEPKGGGGTSHRPVFQKIAEDELPTCVICLTDGYTDYPDGCDVPVLWAMTTEQIAPFGETIRIED